MRPAARPPGKTLWRRADRRGNWPIPQLASVPGAARSLLIAVTPGISPARSVPISSRRPSASCPTCSASAPRVHGLLMSTPRRASSLAHTPKRRMAALCPSTRARAWSSGILGRTGPRGRCPTARGIPRIMRWTPSPSSESRKKVQRTLHPIPGFQVSYTAVSDSVTITLTGKPTFPTGGQITVLPGVTGISGLELGGHTVFTIAAKGRSVTPS